MKMLFLAIIFFCLSAIELLTILRDKQEVWDGAYIGFFGFLILSSICFIFSLGML